LTGKGGGFQTEKDEEEGRKEQKICKTGTTIINKSFTVNKATIKKLEKTTLEKAIIFLETKKGINK